MSNVNNEVADSAIFEDLCRELNMDRETEESSWEKYSEICQRFTLEGPCLHWFCCALYAASRKAVMPTVGESNAYIFGNCVSLNKLLRCCKLSIYDFFSKIKKWQEMANLPAAFGTQMDRLQRSVSITFHLFERYKNIFEQIFGCPRNEKKNTKFRSVPRCSSLKLYHMCWCLYLCAKNENPNSTVDIVTSFSLLICCIDLIYINVLAEKRVDLINTEFKGVPEKWHTPEYNVDVTEHCVIAALCEITPANLEDTKNMKNDFKKIIKKFFETKTICGDATSLLGIVSNHNFERNLNNLKSAYEEYILKVGEFDERMFLNNLKNKKAGHADAPEYDKVDCSQIQSLIPDTPLTRKQQLPHKEATIEPIANATNNVRKLQDVAHILEPSEFIRQAGECILKKLHEKLCKMSKEFFSNYPSTSESSKRFQLSKSLYFYLLEKIIKVEMMTKQNVGIEVLLDNDIFNTILIACCVQIVLYAYNSQLEFPWVLECFSINPFQFLKIVEIVVRRHEDVLTRDLIKHLNFVEEKCLECLAWQKTSLVWEIIKNLPRPLQTWSDVDVSNISRRSEPQLQSPMNSAYETFSTTSSVASARRDLFNNTKDLTEKPLDGNKPFGIFLRKFYKLSWIRMKELCNELFGQDGDSELSLNKIWTLFEYSITQKTELMQDRHLDQILMCAIYLYIRVADIKNKQFSDIMRLYRKQPQANSRIYREVLIGLKEIDGNTEENTVESGDIIKFYNEVYVPKMTTYALKFSEKNKVQNDLMMLSPHPTEKLTAPRKLSVNVQLYVQAMEKSEVNQSPRHLTYDIGKSPAKHLEELNERVRGKRNLPFNDDSSEITIKRPRSAHLTAQVTEMIKDRQEQRN